MGQIKCYPFFESCLDCVFSEVRSVLAEKIKREASRLKAKFHTTDPFEICEALNIRVMRCPMGTKEKSCKGFFIINARMKLITINSDLPEHIQRIICAHELGHAILHVETGLCAFHDFAVFDKNNMQEYEANVFASEFLLTDEDVLEALDTTQEFFGLSSCLNVPPEMLDFKLRLMQKAGYKIKAPYIAKSDFLKRNIDQPLN